MNKRNVTLSLPNLLIKKAKIMAAQKEESLTELMKEALEEKIRENSNYNKAKNRQIRLMRKGFDLGTHGHIAVSREELHERR